VKAAKRGLSRTVKNLLLKYRREMGIEGRRMHVKGRKFRQLADKKICTAPASTPLQEMLRGSGFN
jgi:hypothetical protein